MTREVVTNAAANGAGFVVHVVVAFLLTPVIIHSLGNAAYGAWVLVVSLTSYLGLLDIGFRSTLPKYVSQYHASRDLVGLNRFVSTIFTACVGLAGVSLLLTVVAASTASRLFPVDGLLPGAMLPVLVVLVGCNISVAFPFAVFQGVLLGRQRYVLVNVIGTVALVARSVVTVLALQRGYGVLALAVITVGASVTVSLVFVRLAVASVPELRLRFPQWDRDEVRRISQFSATSFAINVADRVIYYGASLIVGSVLSVAAVTIFSIGESLVAYLRQGVLSLATVLTPAASELDATRDVRRLHDLTIFSTRAVLLLLLPVGVAGVMLGPSFINLWMGPGYEASGVVFSILVAAQVLALGQYGPELILYGINRHRCLAWMMGGIAVTALALSLALVSRYGLVGVAIGYAIPLAIGQTVAVPVFIARYIGLPGATYARRAVLPALLACVPFALVLWSAVRMWPATTWAALLADLTIAAAAYGPGIFFLACDPSERRQLVASGRALVAMKRV